MRLNIFMEHFPNKMLASLFMSVTSRFLSSLDCLLHFFFFFATGSELLVLDEEETLLLEELERARLRFDCPVVPESNCDNCSSVCCRGSNRLPELRPIVKNTDKTRAH